jgi:hypothetical protein
MTRNFLFCFCVFFFTSCNLPDNGIADSPAPPIVQHVDVSPSALEVNKISSQFNPNDPVDTNIIVKATIGDDANSLGTDQTMCTVYNSNGTMLTQQELSDNGIPPDVQANDGIFSGEVHLHFLKKDIGRYTVQTQALGQSNLKSNVFISYINIENTADNAPVLESISSPDSAIIPEGLDSTIIKISVVATDSQGLSDIISVQGTLLSSDGLEQIKFSFYDDGGGIPRPPFDLPSGDSLMHDGRFTALVLCTKSDVGNFTLKVQATDSAQALSNVLTQQLIVRNAIDHPPVVSNVQMPDTTTVPSRSTDTNYVKVSVQVNDQEGLADIYFVSFTSQRPDSSIVGTYLLFDDGSMVVEQPFNIVSGDAVAGDGIYTLTIPLSNIDVTDPSNQYRTFTFQATDRAGEKSNTITKRIYLK